MNKSVYVIYKDEEPFRDLGGKLAHSTYHDAYHSMLTYAQMIAARNYESETDWNWNDIPNKLKQDIIEECIAGFEVVEYVPREEY